MEYFGTININPNADPTQKGMTLLQDYLAGTDPLVKSDVLAITAISHSVAPPGDTTLQWLSKPSRAYAVQYSVDLSASSSWMDVADYGLGASQATFNTGQGNEHEFHRIRAFRPLIP